MGNIFVSFIRTVHLKLTFSFLTTQSSKHEEMCICVGLWRMYKQGRVVRERGVSLIANQVLVI